MHTWKETDFIHTHTETWYSFLISPFGNFLKVELKGKNIFLSYCATLSLSYNKHNSLHGKCLRNTT